MSGLGPLQPLLADPDVTEVMVNGPDRVWVERRGRLERVPMALDGPTIEHLIEKVVAPLGLRIDRSSPLVDARLPDGSRVNAVVPPLAVDGPCLTVRRFGARRGAAGRLRGATGGGPARLGRRRPTQRAGLAGHGRRQDHAAQRPCRLIPAGERIVTVEDAAELRLPGITWCDSEARPANAEGAGQVQIRDLVRNALRMRPDRIVVGEVRGPRPSTCSRP